MTVISASADEQAAAINEVNTAVNHMDQVTQQNAAMAEQATAAGQSLAQESGQLASLVRQFQLGQHDRAQDHQHFAQAPQRERMRRRA